MCTADFGMRWKSFQKPLTAVHDAVHNPGMGLHVNSKSRGVRLTNDMWAELDALAESLDMTTHELIRRRLAASLSVARESRKPEKSAQETVEFA